MTKLVTFLLLMCSANLFSQIVINSEDKKKNDLFAFNTGLSFSSTNFDLDPETKAKRGIFTQLTWHPTTAFRLSAEYTKHFKHNIGIAWADVKAHDIDLNAHLISFLPDYVSYFYPFVGINYNFWSATYTGLFNPMDGYPPAVAGERVLQSTPRINFGCGMEFKLNDWSAFIGEFRFRMMKSKSNLEIADAMYRFGIALHLGEIKLPKRNNKLKIRGKKYKWF